jgi:hypothetical protein
MGQTTSTSLKALALSVLAAGKSVPQSNSTSQSCGTKTNSAKSQKLDGIAVCGSVHCAGCYEVEPGVWIHPPKSSEEWKEWLLKWEQKGRVQ